MDRAILDLPLADWNGATGEAGWIAAVEGGQVLFFPRLDFKLDASEQALLSPALLAEGVRNISLDSAGKLKGVAGGEAVESQVSGLMGRFARQARVLVKGLFPAYDAHLRPAPTSLRPTDVSTRKQSVRADDRRMHVDAFPTRPNYGERILRVFTNINPQGQPRVWRVGEPFEDVAKRYLPVARPYSAWQAKMLQSLHITKSLRSEYDHMMLQLHDRMKADERYQREAPQVTMPFPSGSTWVCFSDQAVHAAMSGQHMLEQTFHLPVARQYDVQASPLAILTRMAGRPLQGAPLP
ncbi:3-deoxy-D-manno-oct-2-ulosonic acid (Kdo) hydroxylase [Ramlibacter sp. G-1-2-2]|uniref:3-deoxy-D-manno-oct-2-ulosonic acid (Kdo) hydroxylase n=1 Tax=Ramlibacter agri TaxID=2728837 RepID=A0A848HAH4_9BURK|nr:Kdo hydroxylase family protein [Ramlibacter agri]NML45463.1 3-deoxy-D-manno-oct-2-ulosonic acid (Kdo) hydroxylase [Ramlibacter agri]